MAKWIKKKKKKRGEGIIIKNPSITRLTDATN